MVRLEFDIPTFFRRPRGSMALNGLRSLRGLQNRRFLRISHQCMRSPCASALRQQRWNTTDSGLPVADTADKPYYITTPIFYVNAGI